MTKEKHSAMKTTGSGHPYTSYVHSRITVYHASKIDLRYCRSLHSCASCKMGLMKDQCGAIHFGVCSAVEGPPSKLRRRSGTLWSTTPSRLAGPTRDAGAVYYKGVRLVPSLSQTNRNSPKTRSLAILREGHELAGTPLDNRATVFQNGVFRLHPQRPASLPGAQNAANSGGGHTGENVGSNVIISAGRNQGGGMAIRLSPGQTNIISDGDTNIEIQGQGRAIHIQSSGGQNVRLRSIVGPGGRPGHVINIHGHSNKGPANYPEYREAKALTVPLSVDVADSAGKPEPLTPKSFLSTTQFVHQKPTARVAPAPAAASLPATPRVSLPATTLSPSPAVDVSSLAGSPVAAQPAPVFYESFASISPSPTPATAGSPVATVSPTKQSVAVVSNESDTVPHHTIQAVTETPSSTSNTNTNLLDSSGKIISNQAGQGRQILHPANDAYLSNQHQKSKDAEAVLQPKQHILKELVPEPIIPTNQHSGASANNRQVKSRKSLSAESIPQFYFPSGKPGDGSDIEYILQNLGQTFSELEGGKAYKEHMGIITKACGFPLYWKMLLFRAAGGTTEGYVTYQGLSALLGKLHQSCHDDASKFMRLTAKPRAKVLEFEDFEPLIQDVIVTHPGLTFLQDAPEFHSRYVTTVISRIMFCVNRSWTGLITVPQLRKSNFLQTVVRLEQEDDINQIKDYFSYEHFYVIYCKFWELDTDHDLFIDREDLSRHNDHALSSRIIDRIFSGAVTRGPGFRDGKMSYREFVWFLLAEVDKKHPTSIEYWFRCMDLDGDGIISMYEMEYFHEEQMMKMETLGIERLPFEDTVCQMMDMVSPKENGKITLRDLKACKMTDIFFDTFFNLDKFLEHEQRDPFTNTRDSGLDATEDSEWNRYAEEEYDILVADEGSMQMDNSGQPLKIAGNFEPDFEQDDDALLQDEILRSMQIEAHQRPPGESQTTEEGYDFHSVPF